MKQVRERQVLYGLTSKWSLEEKKVEFIKTVGKWLPEAGGYG